MEHDSGSLRRHFGLLQATALNATQSVINALITTRILEQFIGQVVGVLLLRRAQPDRPRPYRIWLYPLPCLLALAGWLYMYFAAGWVFISLGLVTLAAGVVVFVIWANRTGSWPFGEAAKADLEGPAP